MIKGTWDGGDVRELRDFLGITQVDLAMLLQTHSVTISKVEKGRLTLPERWIPWLDALDSAGISRVRYAVKAARGCPVAAWSRILSAQTSDPAPDPCAPQEPAQAP